MKRTLPDNAAPMTRWAWFHVHAQLNDFLPARRRDTTFAYAFRERASVKDMIEAVGVPHPEVDLILVNGTSVDFSYLVRHGDRICVYPAAEEIDVPHAGRIPLRPPYEPRFVLDTHLGKLAGYLRLLGFDTLYRNDYDDAELAEVAGREGRILLTRDRGLLKRGAVVHGYFVRETDSRKQVVEVLRRFDLAKATAPYQRCIRCNGLVQPVAKEAIAGRLAPKTRQYYDEFRVCTVCDQIYWKGSHYGEMQRFITELLEGQAAE